MNGLFQEPKSSGQMFVIENVKSGLLFAAIGTIAHSSGNNPSKIQEDKSSAKSNKTALLLVCLDFVSAHWNVLWPSVRNSSRLLYHSKL